jgi:hypothetical protein
MIAAQVPHLIDVIIAKKQADLNDPDMVKLYKLLSGAPGWQADDPRLNEVADVLERIMARAVEAGDADTDGFDDQLVDLLDATMVESAPASRRLLAIMRERGWAGWTRIERVPANHPSA